MTQYQQMPILKHDYNDKQTIHHSRLHLAGDCRRRKPFIEVASKIADELSISLDFLMGKTEVELDKSIINRVVEIQSLPEEDKIHILYAIDGLLQNVRTKLAFAK